MVVTVWVALVLVCLVYVALGVWTVGRIFPGDRQIHMARRQRETDREHTMKEHAS